MTENLPSWVDSHCHLDFPDFADDGVAALVDRARLNRVEAMLTISTHTQRLSRYTALVDEFPNVWMTIGVHPHQANEPVERDITADDLVRLANSHKKIVGIGECGLDYHYDYAPRDVQARVFREHIEAAITTKLPIIIHARQADDDMIAQLKDAQSAQRGLTGVMHCFSSTRKLADFALESGLYISFSGIVTFPKATDLQDICKIMPLDRILVETDAPYLAPMPYRGKRNEPAYVSHTGRFVAQLKDQDEIHVSSESTRNFYRLFSKIGK
jgi:TatD DNase family protein